MRVLKVGGNELDDSSFLHKLAAAVATIQQREAVVIVHGGGRAIAEMHTELKLPSYKVDGLRVTSSRSLDIAEMVLSGKANKLLVRALLAAGVDALGISGTDGGLLVAQQKVHPTADLGYVGEIVAVRTEVITRLIGQGFTPVVSPISADSVHIQPFNINADEAATALAAALKADLFDFISNVPGVLHNDQLIPTLSAVQANDLIMEGVIYGGMIPKVKAALFALDAGVTRTRIVNLDGLLTDGGTVFM
jgi:acetylglutamate kinase